MVTTTDDPYAPHPPRGTTFGNSAGTAFDPTDDMNLSVYMGSVTRQGYDARQAKVAQQLGDTYSGYTYEVPTTLRVSVLANEFNTWGRKKYLYYRDRLIAAGYVTQGYDDPLAVRDGYIAALIDAAKYQATRGGSKVTFDGYLNNLIKMGGGTVGASGKPKKRKTVSVVKDIYSLDPGEARTLLTNALQQQLGRDPTADEIRDFTDAVNQSAEDDPSINKTIVHSNYRADGSVKRQTTTHKTVDTGYTSDDAMWEAMDEAQKNPEYDDYQAVSHYFPVIEQLLNSVV